MADSVFEPGIRVVVPWTRELDTPPPGMPAAGARGR